MKSPDLRAIMDSMTDKQKAEVMGRPLPPKPKPQAVPKDQHLPGDAGSQPARPDNLELREGHRSQVALPETAATPDVAACSAPQAAGDVKQHWAQPRMRRCIYRKRERSATRDLSTYAKRSSALWAEMEKLGAPWHHKVKAKRPPKVRGDHVPTPTREKVLEALRALGRATIRQVAEKTGLSYFTAWSVLSKHAHKVGRVGQPCVGMPKPPDLYAA